MNDAKAPQNDNPNVQVVRELAGSGCRKERSDGIAIVTPCVNRVQSQSQLQKAKRKSRQIDEEQGNTHPKQNPTYK